MRLLPGDTEEARNLLCSQSSSSKSVGKGGWGGGEVGEERRNVPQKKNNKFFLILSIGRGLSLSLSLPLFSPPFEKNEWRRGKGGYWNGHDRPVGLSEVSPLLRLQVAVSRSCDALLSFSSFLPSFLSFFHWRHFSSSPLYLFINDCCCCCWCFKTLLVSVLMFPASFFRLFHSLSRCLTFPFHLVTWLSFNSLDWNPCIYFFFSFSLFCFGARLNKSAISVPLTIQLSDNFIFWGNQELDFIFFFFEKCVSMFIWIDVENLQVDSFFLFRLLFVGREKKSCPFKFQMLIQSNISRIDLNNFF